MRPRHILLAFVVAALWGFNFVVIQLGLGSFPPLLLVALRFAVAAVPVLFLPKPNLPWGRLVWIGVVWFAGQFVMLFSGMKAGMPAGLASVCMQVQAFFTILLAGLVLGEKPSHRQLGGAAVAGLGLALIGTTVSGPNADVGPLGLALVLGGAAAWACGNVMTRSVPKTNMLALVCWLSLVLPLPLLAASLLLDGPRTVVNAINGMTWLEVGCVLYLGVLATNVGFGLWGHLLALYPAGTVAPFSLLVPLFGVIASALVFGERPGPLRLAGMGLIVVGLAIIALPIPRGLVSRVKQAPRTT
jgi:O-acetylserine/cysteine efflux transporter